MKKCTVPVGCIDLEVLEKWEHLEKPFFEKVAKSFITYRYSKRPKNSAHSATKFEKCIISIIFSTEFLYKLFFSPSVVTKSSSNAAFLIPFLKFEENKCMVISVGYRTVPVCC